MTSSTKPTARTARTVVRTASVAGASALLAGGVALMAPALAAGHGGSGGSHTSGGASAYSLTLTDASTAAIDDAGARLDAIDHAWTQRDSAGDIVLRLGRAHSSSSTPTASPTATSTATASTARSGHARTHSGSTGSSTTSGTVTLVGGFDVVDGDASTTWTDLVVDTTDATVSADVDGTTEDVFTIVADATSGSSTLDLTAAGAAALDAVVGADTFAEGDEFATVTPCHH